MVNSKALKIFIKGTLKEFRERLIFNENGAQKTGDSERLMNDDDLDS
ncbi:MAG: hypothetical protein HGB15_07165 [Chlorobaculum sp.]|nr:hypothetical protein [Chlorobaculum sp.]